MIAKNFDSSKKERYNVHMLIVFHLPRLLFLCAIVLHSAVLYDCDQSGAVEEDAFVKACEKWMQVGDVPTIEQSLAAQVIGGRASIEEGIERVLDRWLQGLSSQVTPQSLEQGAHLRDPLDECKNDSASVVEATCCIPNIESDSTTSHSEPKQSLHNAAKTSKTKRARSEFRDREHRAIEKILCSEGNVSAIFRYQINLRRKIRDALKHKITTSAQNSVGTIALHKRLDKEMDELSRLEDAENKATNTPDQRDRIRAMLRLPNFKTTDEQGVDGSDQPRLKLKEMKELRKLTAYELVGTKVKKKDQCIVICQQGMGIGAANYFAIPVFVSAAAEDTGCCDEGIGIVLQMQINSFLERGKDRAANQCKLLQQREVMAERGKDGAILDASAKKELELIHRKLVTYTLTRRRFLLDLVHSQNVTFNTIAKVIQSMKPQEVEGAEASEAHYVLQLKDQIVQEVESQHTTVQKLAKEESEKKALRLASRQRKRHCSDAVALDEEHSAPKNKRYMTPPLSE